MCVLHSLPGWRVGFVCPTLSFNASLTNCTEPLVTPAFYSVTKDVGI